MMWSNQMVKCWLLTWLCFQHPKPTPAARTAAEAPRSLPCCGIIPNGMEAKPVNPLPKPPGWRMDTCRATSPQPWGAMATAVLELGMADRWDENHGTSHGKKYGNIGFQHISGGSMDWYKGLKLQETLGPPKSPNPEWIFRDLGSYLGVQCEVMGISIVITSISWDITPISLWPYAHGF